MGVVPWGRISVGRWRIATLALLLVCVGLFGSGPAFASGTRKGGSTLVVDIAGLPRGARADVVVRGPHLSLTLRRTRTLRGVRPGAYTFIVRQVRLAGGHRIHGGSLALPAVAKQRVEVPAGHSTTAHLAYGTIINSNVRLFTLRPLSVRGEAGDPSAIVLSHAAGIKVGTILTARPSAKLPDGLFDDVVGLRRSGHTTLVKLKPAQITEAFPELDVSSQLQFPHANAAAARVRIAGLEPLVASLGINNFRCQSPLLDSYLYAQESFGVNAHVSFSIPTFFGIPDGLPEGELALTLKASASMEALLRKNVGCSAEVALPPLPGAIPVGPVVVPVYAQVGVFGSATIAEDVQMKAGAGFQVTAGMQFHGFSVRNISGASGNASASASGAGKLTVGVQLRLAVGVASVANVHFDVRPAVAFTANTGGGCLLEAQLGSRIGFSVGPFQLNESLPAPNKHLYQCPPPPSPPKLAISEIGPPNAFPGQPFEYTLHVTNTGSSTADGVTVADTLPGAGSFVSSSPATSSSAPADGSTASIPLGNLAPGQSASVKVRWKAPANEVQLANSAVVSAANASQAGPATYTVAVGATGSCNPCGAASGGTGLRNRNRGVITISGIPAGATVTQAVLVWGILYGEAVPPDTITFQGQQVAANLTSHVSGTLCWGDSATVGYAADVTPYVTGNGTFEVTDPPHGEVRVDENPEGVLPYTDGASLIVFYNGGGADNQVMSNFTYNTNTDPETQESITRSFGGIHSVGGPASLTLAGPDGQNYAKTFSFIGAGEESLEEVFHGSAPQEGPSFPIGNLWDNELFEVGSLLPAGQQTFTFTTTKTIDCIGVGAAVLQVAQ